MLKKIIPVLSIQMQIVRFCLFILFFFSKEAIAIGANDSMWVVDKVIATVDQEVILYSDLESACKQYTLQGQVVNDRVKLELLRKLVLHKIFLAKAASNNIQAPVEAIQRECDMILASHIQQLGSEEAVAQACKMPLTMLKEEIKRAKSAEYVISIIKQNLTSQVVATPAEVKTYFEGLLKNERLTYPTAVEIRQLVRYPKIATSRKEEAVKMLLELKHQITTDPGVTFSDLAIIYSDDLSSASKGGRSGMFTIERVRPCLCKGRT